ncbi:MAG: hypothetical protein Q8R96_11645 [Bacteroidota bacterium]|nr:hypothetical protein [Bacteroidota bacterium]
MERETKQTIVLGYNGTGKSTLVRKIMEAHTSKPDRRALIITPDASEWQDIEETALLLPSDFQFTGARRFIWSFIRKEDLAAMERLRKWYFDGMLIFDDCRSYLQANTNDWLKYLYIRRRQKMIDLMLVTHGFTDVPPQAFTNCSDLFLFKTVDNIDRRKNELINFDEILKAQARVNKKAEENKHYYERIIFKP